MGERLVVNWQDACCLPDKRIAFELYVRDAMIRGAEGIGNLKSLFDDIDRKRNPHHKFNDIFNRAIISGLYHLDVDPSARRQVHVAVRFEKE